MRWMWVCLLVQSVLNRGVIAESATSSSFSITKRARYFDFIAANAENPVSHKYNVTNGSSTFF